MKKLRLFTILSIFVLCLCVVLSACGGNKTPDDSEVSTGATETYYTVTFDSQGGSAVESQRILKGNPVQTPTSPTRGDDIFQGWYKSTDDNAELWNFATDRVEKDITLYAFWSVDISEPTDSITYELNSDRTGYVVTGSGQEAEIVIPDTHGGLPVVEIDERAFAYSRHTSDILSVTIPDSVTKIGLNAFHNQDALVTVNIGTGSKLQSIGNNAFSGNSLLEAIYLPVGFTTLGNDVFNNCGSLNTITVASGNAYYSGEGNNLIEIATHTLIRGSNKSIIPSSVTEIAPSAFRHANGITTLNIPLSVVKIGNYIIADSTINSIRYEGTEEEWEEIEKARLWNMGKTDIEIVYSTTTSTSSNVLVAYFSRTGENYGVGNIPSGGYAGYIEKGNTEIVAEMIAEETNGTLFEIVPVVPYPDSYSEMLNIAREEVNTNARPAIKDTVENFDDYDIIFLGYPIWNGNCPNILYTFMEAYDFSGKEVIPFCTHAGSGLGSSMSTIRNKLTNATVLNGLAVSGATAQNNRDTARMQVKNFIEGLDIDFGSNAMAQYNFSDFSNVELINADIDSMKGEEIEILYLQAKYCQAMTDADIDTMKELTAEEMTFTHMSGRTQTRDEYFADVKNGSLRYFTIGIDSPVVKVNGNTASIAYTSVLNANAYGAQGTYRMSGTHYYEKRSGSWIAVNKPSN